MNKNTFQKVCSVSGSLHGAVVQSNLERAGIPVTLDHTKNASYLDVLVPEERVYDAKILLFIEPRVNTNSAGPNPQ
ncbi:MAG: hypothetical protein M1281_00750 [Chloroflexi bacterium]|nr:hypothetical protein [Chloroflexota bacterium]